MKDNQKATDSVRLNITVNGEPAKWLKKWKKRGLVTSCRDSVIQAFRVYNQKIVEEDLKAAQLKTLKEEL